MDVSGIVILIVPVLQPLKLDVIIGMRNLNGMLKEISKINPN